MSQVAILALFIAQRRASTVEAEGDLQVEPVGETSLDPTIRDLVDSESSGDAGNEAAVAALLNSEELAIQVDRSEPFMHLRFETTLPSRALPPNDPNLTRLMGSLGDILPLIP